MRATIAANEYRKQPMKQAAIFGAVRGTLYALGSETFYSVQRDVGTRESADVLNWLAARDLGIGDYSLSTRTFSARGPLGPWPTV